MRAADLRPGDLVGSRTVARVVTGKSAGPVAVPVVLVRFTSGAPVSYVASHRPPLVRRP